MYMFSQHVHKTKTLSNKWLYTLSHHHVHVCAEFYKKNRTCNPNITNAILSIFSFALLSPPLLLRFKSVASPFHSREQNGSHMGLTWEEEWLSRRTNSLRSLRPSQHFGNLHSKFLKLLHLSDKSHVFLCITRT